MTANSSAPAYHADLYLRLSDLRVDRPDTIEDRIAKCSAEIDRLGWTLNRFVVENDVIAGNKDRKRGASGFKRRKIALPNGKVELRVFRPGFRSILDDFTSGRATALYAEDLDRCMRDPRDLEDLIDVVEAHKINARSSSGSLKFTDGGTESEITTARIMVVMANKSSRDTARRVADSRARKALNGEYGGGGKRPFGFEPDGVTVRPDEAAIVEMCSRRVLQVDRRTELLTSVRLLAAELRDAGVPTVTGTEWTADVLRGILVRPRNAGILVHRGEEAGQAPWPPIVPPHIYRAVARLLTDPARTFGPGPAPRWLGSGLYLCGVCNDGTTCEINGHSPSGAPRYRCKKYRHLARNAGHVDSMVIAAIVDRLARRDAADLIAPVGRPAANVDVPALQFEADTIRATLNAQAEDQALGLMDRAQVIAGSRAGLARLKVIAETMNAGLTEAPFANLIGVPDVEAAFKAEPLSVRRTILARMFTVTLLPGARMGPGFDQESVRIEPRTGVKPRVAGRRRGR